MGCMKVSGEKDGFHDHPYARAFQREEQRQSGRSIMNISHGYAY